MKTETREASELTPEVESLLDDSEYGYLGVVAQGEPYVVPISFAREGQTIYIHTGLGKKVDALNRQARACLTVVDVPRLVKGEGSCNVGFAYRSALILGVVRAVEDLAEKNRALERFVAKYHAKTEARRLPAATVERTLVFAIEPERVTVKIKKAD